MRVLSFSLSSVTWSSTSSSSSLFLFLFLLRRHGENSLSLSTLSLLPSHGQRKLHFSLVLVREICISPLFSLFYGNENRPLLFSFSAGSALSASASSPNSFPAVSLSSRALWPFLE